MSRILLLLVFLLWMAGTSDASTVPPDGPWLDAGLFLGFYGLLVAAMGLWSRFLVRRVALPRFHRSLRRFNQVMLVARLLVPGWFAFGMFVLGWGWVVEEKLGLGVLGPVRLPGLLLGTLPAVLAWVGLWWSQYPAERTLREQHIWVQLEDDIPVHAPPSLREYFVSNLRLQVLFTLVPVLLIVAVRDIVAVTVFDRYLHHQPAASVARTNGATGIHGMNGGRVSEFRRGDPMGRADRMDRADRPDPDGGEEMAEFLTFLLSAGLVFVFAPEILRRVLKTSPLPDGPLRRRLEALCRRTGMKYRDILVWHTENNMGNAAVMGVVPRMRYVLLSDLLLERMDDDQLEAVFAHEIGHIVHRHMVWYVVFFLTLLLVLVGPMRVVGNWFERFGLSPQAEQLAGLAAAAGGFWLLFGFLSRRFERQADVYAARVIEVGQQPAGGSGFGPGLVPGYAAYTPAYAAVPAGAGGTQTVYDRPSFVGPFGARLFASALHRVAVINNIPVSPRSRRDGGVLQRVGYLLGSFMDLAHDWLHGSIPNRMAYLQSLSADPDRTSRFDRVMARLYCALLFCLFASAAWTWMALAGTR